MWSNVEKSNKLKKKTQNAFFNTKKGINKINRNNQILYVAMKRRCNGPNHQFCQAMKCNQFIKERKQNYHCQSVSADVLPQPKRQERLNAVL